MSERPPAAPSICPSLCCEEKRVTQLHEAPMFTDKAITMANKCLYLALMTDPALG